MSACLIAGCLWVVTAPAMENDLLQPPSQAAFPQVEFTLMPKTTETPLFGAIQPAEGSPVPGTPRMARSLTGNAEDPLPPLSLGAIPADTKPSAALILAGGSPTAVMTDNEPDDTSNQPATVRPAKGKETTQVNVFTGLGTTSGQDYTPLTGEQRWKYYLNQNFTSWGAIVGPLLSSVIDQVNSQPPEWGDGMDGYARRLASRLGTGIVQGTAQSAGCALLGQEPRYIKSSSKNVFARIGHGFLYSLITYNNEGEKRPAIATLASYYASSITTNLWMPNRYTALGDGVRDGNRQVILAGFVNQWQEFWPEIRRYIFRRP